MTSPRSVFFGPLSSHEDERSSNHRFTYENSRHFHTNLATVLVLLGCALACGLALNVCICCFWRRQPEEAEDEAGSGPMSAEVMMAAVPTLVYSAGGSESDCAICLSEFVKGEKVRVLPKCNHYFHDRCIEGWLASKPSCPTCRRKCFSPEQDVIAGNSAEAGPEPEGMVERAPE